MNKDYYLRQEGQKFFMCCGKANCPSVEMNKDGLIAISDDYGNTVKMKVSEAKLIKEAVLKLSKDEE